VFHKILNLLNITTIERGIKEDALLKT
jgi:hypothetical protein